MKLPRKKTILIIPVVLFLLLLSWKLLPIPGSAEDPQAALNTAIAHLEDAPALSYQMVSHLTVEGTSKEYGNIHGELLQNGNTHLEGEILGSPLHLYRLGDSTYRLDPVTEQWQKTIERTEEEENALFYETNPLKQLEISDYGEIEELAAEERNSRCFRFSPSLSENALTQYFTDLVYTVYCSDDLLTKVVVNGKLTNNSVEGQLNIVTQFTRLPADYTLEAPITEAP